MDRSLFGLVRASARVLGVACVALLVTVFAGGCGGGGGSYTFRSNAVTPEGQGSGSVRVTLTVVEAVARTRAITDYSLRVHIQQSGVDVVTPQTVTVPGMGIPIEVAFINVPPGVSSLVVELLDAQGNVLGLQEQPFTVQPQANVSLEVQIQLQVVVTPNPGFADAGPGSTVKATRAFGPGGLGTQVTFQASGGVPAYTWTLSTNNSGGTIDATGLYTAGLVGDVDDYVTATDSLGNAGTARVHVYPPLVINPVYSTSALPEPFTISAGSGTGYTVTIDQNQTGGALTYVSGATTGTWTPGVNAGVDVIVAHDSLGGQAILIVSPPSP